MSNYNGLTSREAEEKLIQNGKNCLREEKPKSIFRMFCEQIFNFTNFILAAAIIISIVLGDYGEAGIIGFIILLNAIIGVVQEGRAQKALEALKKMSIVKATVIRDGEKKEISSEDLVVGDIVLLEAGQQVPADLKLLETFNLKIDEKALTGESVPIEKDENFVAVDETVGIGDRLDRAYMSTIVTYGRGIGEVRATGMNTEIGKIADMVGKEKDEPSPLQKGMAELSKTLGIVAVVICAIMFVVGLLQGRDMLDLLMTAVSLAVAAIPEGIPTIVTIVMALGMQRMAKVNAIVKTLPAVETLGAVGIVCSDKTGTLTQNKMTVVQTYCDGKFTDLTDVHPEVKEHFLNGFVLCNDASISSDGKEIGDPTETALVAFGLKHDIIQSELEKEIPRFNEKSFDSDRKLMTTVHRTHNDSCISYTKGSTDELLKRCEYILDNNKIRDIRDADIQNIENAMKQMSDEALRVLSLAIRFDNENAEEDALIYVGMLGMIDPERQEVVESVKVFKRAGVKTVMITGDHKDTAFAIAKRLGIAEDKSECIMGHEIDEMTDDELRKRAKTLSIFARVSPEHKVRIVKAYKDNGNVVSMTGDGVNDAPSLKAADVGVAMGITGTDVAKGAADIILQDDSFTTIEKAIREGRNIYENIKKSIVFSLSSNIGEILTMFTAIAVGLAAPLKAVHILWINLITDSLPCIALGVDPNSSSDVMNKKPRRENESIFAGGAVRHIAINAVLIALITLSGFLFPAFQHLFNNNIPFSLSAIIDAYKDANILAYGQTYAFSILAISELFHAIGARDEYNTIFKFKWFDNKMMIIACVVGVLGQVAVTEIPFLTQIFGTVSLSFVEWLAIFGVASLSLVMHEIMYLAHKIKHRKGDK